MDGLTAFRTLMDTGDHTLTLLQQLAQLQRSCRKVLLLGILVKTWDPADLAWLVVTLEMEIGAGSAVNISIVVMWGKFVGKILSKYYSVIL